MFNSEVIQIRQKLMKLLNFLIKMALNLEKELINLFINLWKRKLKISKKLFFFLVNGLSIYMLYQKYYYVQTQTKYEIANNVDNGWDRLLRRGIAEGRNGWRGREGLEREGKGGGMMGREGKEKGRKGKGNEGTGRDK